MDERMRKMKMAQGAQWMKDQGCKRFIQAGMVQGKWCTEGLILLLPAYSQDEGT